MRIVKFVLSVNVYQHLSCRPSFNKLLDTADIISQLAKHTKSSSARIKKPISQSTSSIDVSNKIPKFKTSGLVATAVVQPRKPRKSITQQTPLILQTSSPSLRIVNDCNSDSEQENVKIPLRRKSFTRKSLRLFKESASRLEKSS